MHGTQMLSNIKGHLFCLQKYVSKRKPKMIKAQEMPNKYSDDI